MKLGKSSEPTLVSLKDKKIIDGKTSILEKHIKVLSANNDEIISQNQKLLARLEKLGNIVLKFKSKSESISAAIKE